MPFDAQAPAEVTARDRVIQLRDFLANEVPDKHFDMTHWSCGTAACIGGWADRLFCPEGEDAVGFDTAKALGLTFKQAYDLFYMNSTNRTMISVTRADAVAVLDNYLSTGQIDWSIT